MPVTLDWATDSIAVVTIENPTRRNALAPADFISLGALWETLAADSRVRCAVVTGAGSDAFCSGADLSADFGGIADINNMVDRALLKARLFDKPLIAAVNGHCVAGGFELMLSSDIRIVSDHAKLGLPEVRWGIMPSGGGAMKLIDQIGYAPALELLLTGTLITAQQAQEMKLVNRVVPGGEVMSAALETARLIAGNSPVAVRSAKRAALQPLVQRWASQEPFESEAATHVRQSADAREGRAAFLEKRQPFYPTSL